MKKYKSNNNIVFSCKYHIIWCPKYRRKVLTKDISDRLKEIILEVATEFDVDILEIETDLDHIHLLVDLDPQFGVTKFIKKCKGRSSNLLRKEFPDLKSKLPALWSSSAFITTVGSADSLEMIKDYIQNQQTSSRHKSKENWENYLDHCNGIEK